MEEITKRWNQMSLQGPEKDQFDLRSDMGSKDSNLGAKFYTKRIINVEAVARNFSLLWRKRNGFKIKDQGNHIILFIFENKFDCEKILSSQPWSFDKFLVVFQKYYNNTHVRDLDFERVPFWVQVYDIPVSFMNKTVAEGLCSGIGEVCSTDFSVMEGGDHVRVRVILNVTKPLCCGRKFSLEGGSTGWVSFKYERLPSLCFWCGCLTHGERDCKHWMASGGSLTVEDRKYGTWLRAPLSNNVKRSTIAVPGFFQQKKASHASTVEEKEPVSKPHQPVTPASRTSTSSTEKVTPKSELPIFSYSVAYPSVRDGDEFPPGFEGHLHTKGNFPHSLSVSDEKQGKVDVMDEGVGNLEPLPRVRCEHLNNLRKEGNNVNGEWGFEG